MTAEITEITEITELTEVRCLTEILMVVVEVTASGVEEEGETDRETDPERVLAMEQRTEEGTR